MTRVIIAGSRHFDDYELLKKTVDSTIGNQCNIEIISGGCIGADKLGERYAREKRFPVKVFRAEWKKYGRAAGPIRNKAMAEYAIKADNCALVAFPVDNSPGTRNMIRTAQDYGMEICVIESEVIK